MTIDIGRHDKEKDETKTSSKKNIMKKKAPIKVRKVEEVREIKEDRFLSREEKNKKMEGWQKHWEKDSTGKPKNLGGNKRPRYFDTDKIDYDKKDFSRPLPEHKKVEKLEKEASEKSDKEFSTFRDKK